MSVYVVTRRILCCYRQFCQIHGFSGKSGEVLQVLMMKKWPSVALYTSMSKSREALCAFYACSAAAVTSLRIKISQHGYRIGQDLTVTDLTCFSSLHVRL